MHIDEGAEATEETNPKVSLNLEREVLTHKPENQEWRISKEATATDNSTVYKAGRVVEPKSTVHDPKPETT